LSAPNRTGGRGSSRRPGYERRQRPSCSGGTRRTGKTSGACHTGRGGEGTPWRLRVDRWSGRGSRAKSGSRSGGGGRGGGRGKGEASTGSLGLQRGGSRGGSPLEKRGQDVLNVRSTGARRGRQHRADALAHPREIPVTRRRDTYAHDGPKTALKLWHIGSVGCSRAALETTAGGLAGTSHCTDVAVIFRWLSFAP